MLRSPHKDKENLPTGVAALVTPARHPFKSVANTGTPARTKHSDVSKRLTKKERKSKKLSAPLYNQTQLISDVLWRLKHSPVLESDSPGQTEKGNRETLSLKERESEIENFVEEVVRKILKEVMKNEANLKQESSLQKMEEYKSIILQMNKERLWLERQLADLMKNVAAKVGKDVSLSKENQTMLQNQELEQELVLSRERERNAKEHCNKLFTQIDALVADTDLYKMEISRQQDVINRQQIQINDLKVELSASLEQMESLQSQQQEMNEFTEEERRNLEVSVREMENQLKLTSLSMSELNGSLKSKSEQCAKLIEEVKQSRSLLKDKQEELDATQSQAHWLVLQQEAMMSETANELNVISDLVNDLLRKFTEESCLGERGEEADKPEVRRALVFSVGSDNKGEVLHSSLKSLVQSVLEARARKQHEIESNSTHHRYETRPVTKLSPIPETLENELDCSRICDDEQKPLSLTEQVLELKQALERLVEIGSGQAASVEAQKTIKRLEEDRMLAEQQYESSLQMIRKELEDSKTREVKLRREVSRKSSDISALQLELKESAENLQHSFQKIESLGQQFEKTIDQQARITELSADLQRCSEDVKKLERDKECLSQHLMECLATLDQLSPPQSNLNQTQSILGKLMGDKFNLEKKVQELKEKAINYRLETQDYMTEYKLKTDSKIRILEGNLEKAETEICRLDALMEKIRLVLHHSVDEITCCPDLLKLRSFLDGEDIQ